MVVSSFFFQVSSVSVSAFLPYDLSWDNGYLSIYIRQRKGQNVRTRRLHLILRYLRPPVWYDGKVPLYLLFRWMRLQSPPEYLF